MRGGRRVRGRSTARERARTDAPYLGDVSPPLRLSSWLSIDAYLGERGDQAGARRVHIMTPSMIGSEPDAWSGRRNRGKCRRGRIGGPRSLRRSSGGRRGDAAAIVLRRLSRTCAPKYGRHLLGMIARRFASCASVRVAA